MSENFTTFIIKASQENDLVFIDTQPIRKVTDAAIIGN